MRRHEREIVEFAGKIQILDECKVCRLGLADKNEPYVVPLNYGYEIEDGNLALYFHGAREGKKTDIIKNNNRACFEADCGHQLIEAENAWNYSYAYRSVMAFGVITILEDLEEKRKGLICIMNHQTGAKREWKLSEEALKNTNVYRMDVSEFTGKRHDMN